MWGFRLVLLHLGQHISHNTPIKIFRHPQKLRPRKDMIEVIFHLIIFGKTPEIALLHLDEIVDGCHADVHHCWCERSMLVMRFEEKSIPRSCNYCGCVLAECSGVRLWLCVSLVTVDVGCRLLLPWVVGGRLKRCFVACVVRWHRWARRGPPAAADEVPWFNK